MNKIPVFSTIADIYKETFGDIKRYTFLIGFWALIIGASTFCMYELALDYILTGGEGGVYDNLPLPAILFTLLLVLLCAIAYFFVTTSFLRSSMEDRTVLTVGVKELLFVFTSIALTIGLVIIFFLGLVVFSAIIGLIAGGIMMILPAADETTKILVYIGVGSIGALLAILLTSFIGVRFSLIFADIYAKNSIGITKCWKATKGNFWRLWFITVCSSLPLTFANLLMPAIEYDETTGVPISGHDAWAYSNPYAFTIASLVWVAFLPLIGTAIAKMYKFYTNPENKIFEQDDKGTTNNE